jgi:TolB-like protein
VGERREHAAPTRLVVSSAAVAGGKNEPKDKPRALHDISTPTAPRLSVVILPFVNIGGSAGDDRLANGITETLTTDLSRISGVFVISRTTAYAYKDKSIDARQIGRELGVRYVLEGSVQNTRSRTRINAQLVDAASGAHLWAERFDKQGADLLDVQDEITTRLVRNVHIELIAAESRRVAREVSGISAYETDWLS